MKIKLTEEQYNTLKESYKLTLNDKQEIDKIIKKEYQKYLKDYKNAIEGVKMLDDLIKNDEYTKDLNDQQIQNLKYMQKGYMISVENKESKIHIGKPKLYNEFYEDTYQKYSEEYKKTVRKPSYPNIPEGKKLNEKYVNEYFDSLNQEDLNKIQKFITVVGIRQSSGTGESISKKIVRDTFFKTPIEFQHMFSVKPSKWFWRGDDIHPCDEKYEQNPYHFYMQSFSEWKSGTEDFGSISFPSTRIGSYKGCFSAPLFVKYHPPRIESEVGDDEGEIMFFDVIYKCNKKFKINEN